MKYQKQLLQQSNVSSQQKEVLPAAKQVSNQVQNLSNVTSFNKPNDEQRVMAWA